IDSDTFERIQARLATFNPMNKTRIIQPRALNSNYLLSGFLRCQCGSPLSGTQAKSGKYAYYSCVKQCKMGKAQCEMRPIPQHHLENIVINYLKTGLLTEDNISLLLKNHKDKHESGSSKLKVRLKNVERELVAARKSRDNILDYIEVEGKFSDDDTGQRLRERKLQIINLELEQSQLKAAIINPPSCEISAADIRSYIIHCERILNEATIGEKKELLRSIIQGITVNWNGKEWAGILKYSFPASDISGTGNKVPGLVVNGSP
ncbi:MAG: zinc ribbon domain-containing protein, partial [bacterium]